MRRAALSAVVAVALVAVLAGSGRASSRVTYGLQDDAWLHFGPGTLDDRVAALRQTGIQIARVTVRWDVVESTRGTFDWSRTDAIVEGLHDAGIAPLLTLYGTPEWANGGRPASGVPLRGSDFASFARAVADRYPFVRRFTVWNEPNQRRSMTPVSPALYVARLLNPAYAAIHDVAPSAKVAGGETAPRGGTGGMSPVAFMRGMSRAGARLDAYAHHPYALRPGETPWGGGCGHCETITMATIEHLVTETQRAFGPVRLWLTELGYQSNPPDRLLGVPPATQATFVAAAAYRAWATQRVDLLIQYLYRDEPSVGRWQSGLETVAGSAKPALRAMALPLAQVGRAGVRTLLWGQVRPGSGRRAYALQRLSGGRWVTVGGVRRTGAGGILRRVVEDGRGARYRLLSMGVGAGNVLVVR